MISSSKSLSGDGSPITAEHKRQSSPADEANLPSKRQAILSRADREASDSAARERLCEKFEGPDDDNSSSVPIVEAKAAKIQLKEALLKRKTLLAAELRHLEGSNGLLDFVESDLLCLDAPSPAPTPTVDDEQQQDEPVARNTVGRKGFERWHGLSDEDKLLLQKAKVIEANNRHKVKWPEPPRRKIHHDYLMEEMTWLATDFRNERKWKMAQAKKVASAVVKYHNQQQQKIDRAEKDKEVKVRKQATKIAREVRRFWMQIETLAQHKQQAKMDIEKKKVLGKHLDFLVDQTEKYSTMIAQNLTLVPTVSSEGGQVTDSGKKDDKAESSSVPITDPEPVVEHPVTTGRRGTRRTQLRGNMSGPQSANPASRPSASSMAADNGVDDPDKGDTDFKVEKEEEDDEATIEEDEMNEDKEEIANEVNELQAEQDMPIEELLAKYGCMMKNDKKGDPGEENEDEENSSEEEEEEEDVEDDEKAAESRKGEEEASNVVGDNSNSVADTCADKGLESFPDSSQPLANDSQQGGPSSSRRVDSRQRGDKDADDSSGEDEESSSDENTAELGDEGGSYRSMYRQLNGHATGSSTGGAIPGGEGEVVTEDGRRSQDARPAAGGDGLSGEARDVADMARTLAPTGHTLATTRVKTAVPVLLSKKLRMREYQHIALDWMIALYDKGLNGILADEMGLGKTIMTISVLAYLACERGIWGPHLIVVPTSLLLNWEIELKRWCPAFKVLTYYGSPKERKAKRQGWSKANSFHVCISSYKMVVQDQKMFRRKKWKYLILDEAHNIKNFQSQRWQVLLNFRTKRRLLLTGTPLQNNLMELWSLLHFLMPHIFTSHSEFKDWFANPLMSMVEGNSAMNDTLVQRLHSVLRPFILRRLKKDVEKQLPEKKEHVVTCRLSKRQRCLYDDFLAAGATQAKLSSGNLLEIINVLMQLRKVCNHPDLFEERPIVSPFDCLPVGLSLPRAVDQACAREPRAHVGLASLNFILTELESCGRAEAAARRAYQPTPPLIEELCGPGWDKPAPDCSAEESGRGVWASVAQYRAAQAARQRAERGRSLALMMRVNALRCEGVPVYGADLCRAVRVALPVEDAVRASEDPRRHAAYPAPLRDLILRADERVFGRGGREGTAADRARRPQLDCCGREVGSLLDTLTNFVCIIPSARCAPASVVWSRRDLGAEGRLEEAAAGVARVYSAVNDVCRPAHIRQQLYFPDKRLLQYDCGKLQVLDGMLRRLKAEGHRVLLFTQMSKVLDVVETFLCFQGHTYMRLDGSTKIEMRQKLVERFNQDPKVFVFISSTRAGGVGINLTGADTVVFYDSDWNPAMDRQAQDRCHRIGQTREVHIYRLVSEHTVEENILRKANQKRHLEDLALKDSATSLFNPDFFKKVDVRDLFNDEPAAAAAVAAAPAAAAKRGPVTERDWEAATAAAEDENDAAAARLARAEEKEEAHEFDEDAEAAAAAAGGEGAAHAGSGSEGEDGGRGEAAALRIEDELTPVQRYALRFVEEQLRAAAAAAPQPPAGAASGAGAGGDKEGWEAEQLRRIQARDDDRLYDEDEVLLYETAGCRAQG